jgi:hypothetical protein
MIDEETLEAVLRVVRTADIHDAREWLREFAVSVRHAAMIDLVKAMDSAGETNEQLHALKAKVDAYLATPVQTWDHLTNEG